MTEVLFAAGQQLYESHEYNEALTKFHTAALQGHAGAMRMLGQMFVQGDGVEQDAAQAFQWFSQSAEMGDFAAMRQLAIQYMTGTGVAKSTEDAAHWFRLSARGGDVVAMRLLGYVLRSVDADDPEQIEWLTRGTEAGDAVCMRMLGLLVLAGSCGLECDVSRAIELFECSVALGDSDSIVFLAMALHGSGDFVRSAEYYRQAAESGNASAMICLGSFFYQGIGVEKSFEKAVEWFQRAAELDNAVAMVCLGELHESGDGVVKSAERAVELYQRASDLGNASAMVHLCMCYGNGVGVPASDRIATEFLLRAVASGDTDAKKFIDSVEPRDVPVMMAGLLSGREVDGATAARKLLMDNRDRLSVGDFMFYGDRFPLDRIGDSFRLFAEFKHSIQSMQFALRLDNERPPACSGEEQLWFNRVGELVRGARADESDAAVLKSIALLLATDRDVPLELFEALKRVVDARVAKLTVKSVLPLVCVLEELDRATRSLEFSDKARFVVRACVFGAICEHLLAAELPSDLTSETALETTLLWLGVVRQAEFFGGVQMERVAVVERDVDARLHNDKAARDKYALILVRDLKRRVPYLLLATPEFAAASAAKLDGEIENKRVKVILLGDSGVGKTQIRRRLGGVHAFEAKHTSTDTAEVTSVEVTSLCVASTTRWIERDDSNTSENVKLHGPAFVRSLMFAATGVDYVSHASILSNAREPEHASSSDARGVAPMKSVLVTATCGDASTVAVSETIAPAMHADVSVSSARAPAAPSLSSFVPQELDFSVMDERKVLSLWDFGGQVEYFAVHDLFLTSGAVYVLVVDWTKGVDKARESTEMWMNAIRAHVGDDALVLPVLPRCAEDSDDDNAVDEVVREVKKLVGCMPVRVDSATDRNYTELKSKLLKLSEDCMAINGKVPMRWLQVHDELCRLRAEETKQWITRNEFRTLLQSLHGTDAAVVSNEAVEDALTFLKQSGTVLTCDGGELVSDYVFLDPELFLQLVRPLINTKEQMEKRDEAACNDAGVAAAQRNLSRDFERMNTECIASRALLEHLWRGVQSPTGEIGFFVELLEHCGLMCELEHGAYFVPAASKASPIGSVKLDWISSGEQIAFVCDAVTAVPPSLLPRVVASLLKSGAIDKLSRQRIVTRSDVVLLLRAGGGDVRRMRLLQRGNAFVITLQRVRGDDDAAARDWRVRAYAALFCAIESVLRFVFRSLKVRASVLCSECKALQTSNVCSTCDVDLTSIDAWLPRKDDELFAQRQNWRVMSVTNETLDAFLERPTLDALLKWCGEHCDSVRAGVATCFPVELRELDAFWAAVRQVAHVYRGRTTFDAAVFYPGRETGGKVLLENHLADAIQRELGKTGKRVYYADLDRNGRFDENIVAAVVGCRRAVFVVSRLWFERKWCLAEMLLAIATGDDSKCKVIQFGDDFRADLLPLHQRIVRARFDAKKLMSEEVARLTAWVAPAPSIDDN
jgi:TPR repeat protein/GTPase SAR1 family protein